MAKSPAFQFYPSDFTMGTQFMTCEAIGAYMKLLCADWANDGIPNNEDVLGRLCVCSEDALRSAMSKFRGFPDGLLRNDRLQEERIKQEKRRDKSKKANDKRWNKPSTNVSLEESYEDITRTTQGLPKTAPEDSPSSSLKAINIKSYKDKDKEKVNQKNSTKGLIYEFMKIYPKPSAVTPALKSNFAEAIHAANGEDVIMVSVKLFAEYIETSGKEIAYVPKAENWLRDCQWNIDWKKEAFKAMPEKEKKELEESEDRKTPDSIYEKGLTPKKCPF